MVNALAASKTGFCPESQMIGESLPGAGVSQCGSVAPGVGIYGMKIARVMHRRKPLRDRYVIQWNKRRPTPAYARNFCDALAAYTILKGDRPADLPIDRASKFELVVNMKTARTLGIDMPLSIQMRIDEVIE